MVDNSHNQNFANIEFENHQDYSNSFSMEDSQTELYITTGDFPAPSLYKQPS